MTPHQRQRDRLYQKMRVLKKQVRQKVISQAELEILFRMFRSTTQINHQQFKALRNKI